MSTTVRRPSTTSRTRSAHGSARRARRRDREQAIVATTRALFDAHGMRDASIDAIAHAAGINKALIYRAFDSKEEIFVLTVTDYLAELEERGRGDAQPDDPAAALRQCLERYVGFGLEYPAFLDCALSLMQQPASDLRERVSGAIWFRLGRAMAPDLGRLERILADGAERGAFAIDDPDFMANRMYTQILGSLHLARAGVGVREAAPGVAATFDLDPERVGAAVVEDALAMARITGGAQGATA